MGCPHETKVLDWCSKCDDECDKTCSDTSGFDSQCDCPDYCEKKLCSKCGKEVA